MTRTRRYLLGLVAVLVLAGAGTYRFVLRPEAAQLPVSEGVGPHPKLPPPNATLMPTVNIARPLGWKNGEMPHASEGLSVKAFATGLNHPRWLYALPNGDVLVAETNSPGTDKTTFKNRIARAIQGLVGADVPSPNRIILLRDADGDGVAEKQSVFLEHLNSPFGMALIKDTLYVANADAIWRFPYQTGQITLTAPGEKVVDLPSGYNHHWTKNILASPDGQALYVTIGSNSNVAENGLHAEEGRARIDKLDLTTGKLTPFATGLRNPNGMAWEPQSGALWTVVNERDEIGSDLVPDYLTSVKEGAFYGWPFSYYGSHVDVRVKPQNPELVASAIAPDYALGPHTASLGLVFAEDSTLPAAWRNGAFIAQHGSWNRRPKSGYKVIFVPFSNGHPSGAPVDVLTGFLTPDEDHVHGRPVGLALDQTGALLVADDVGNVVWRVSDTQLEQDFPAHDNAP
ncbi:PQQ-dependent sugar dehydrogenase [Acetobacter orleanensis]|uniref:Sorbosone dehydrogenase n=1 Tax=Acetobacter orleanensis TaxID=104099 RepID=A0A4Y3TMY0_9PROT|nr:sorbosone dehydrogenase family protein [Acetobacter orleanensis]KXV63962.1 L-sorbosone dehydrogenase [Acetobacter orleanensis]PCD79738.1 L-sorbosone dehydrogenase [Acetobacter orleanensis]GAN69310.1 L-sorbosone dehydrogenase [Acetobacter orleanensis JCM 7639]GBR28354.1 L-sorbosone dehydrogenase [Acetobacter orleanensis NRIC 0473]GEB82165.1 sorbosone dehydrogenase [Acetobacter orleanensis]